MLDGEHANTRLASVSRQHLGAFLRDNARGEVRLHARLFEGVCRGVLIAESIWPNGGLCRRLRH